MKLLQKLPFPVIESQGRASPSWTITAVVFSTPSNLSKIVTEAPFLNSLKDSPLLRRYFACDAWDTWQSYQAELRTAELIGEACLLPLASCVKFFVRL